MFNLNYTFYNIASDTPGRLYAELIRDIWSKYARLFLLLRAKEDTVCDSVRETVHVPALVDIEKNMLTSIY